MPQSLASRIVFPRGSGRKYRDAVKYVSSYTMEELAHLLFVGGAIAHRGPDGFQRLWKPFRKSLTHYIYGHGATEEAMRMAAQDYAEFCEVLEDLVIKGQVITSHLKQHAPVHLPLSRPARSRYAFLLQIPSNFESPNVHIGRCQFPVQELRRGLCTSEEAEWHMERYMQDPKTGMRALHPEKTFINAVEMSRRALSNARTWHGCITAAELKERRSPGASSQRELRDPGSLESPPEKPHFQHKGRRYSIIAGSPLPDREVFNMWLANLVCDAVRKAADGLMLLSTQASQAAGDLAAEANSAVQRIHDRDRDKVLDVQEATAVTLLTRLATNAARAQSAADATYAACSTAQTCASKVASAVREGDDAEAQEGFIQLHQEATGAAAACEPVTDLAAQCAADSESALRLVDYRKLKGAAAALAEVVQPLLHQVWCLEGWGSVDSSSTEELLSRIDITIFQGCQLDTFVACSSRQGNEKAEAASWVVASVGAAAGSGEEQRQALVHVLFFVLLERRAFDSEEGTTGVTVPPMRVAFGHTSEEWVRSDMVGTPTFIAPADSRLKLRVLDVCTLLANCVYLRPSGEADSHLRLIPFTAKAMYW